MYSNPPSLTLDAGVIHIWPTPVADFLHKINDYQSLLTETEYRRAQRYYFEKDRHNFIISRGRLRTLIERYCGIPAKSLNLSCNKYDKPFIDEARHKLDTNLYFNVSHSHDYILYAFSLNKFIGIDIEYMSDNRSLDDLAKRCYTYNEMQQYRSSTKQAEVFYKLWSHKEAYLKAIGTGLSTSLKNFEIQLNDDPHSNINEIVPFNKNMSWYAYDLRLFENYQAALACSEVIENIQVFNSDG